MALMNFESGGVSEPLGVPEPLEWVVPDAVASDELEGVVDFAREMVGKPLDAAQEHVFRGALGIAEDGYWAARHVGVCMPRQNGKTYMLALRALYGANVLGEQLIIHSAQNMGLARAMLRYMDELIHDTPALLQEYLRTDYGGGRECLEWRNGCRLRFVSRDRAGGSNFRGESVDCVIFDEAAYLSEDDASAALYASSARPEAQFWYAGTAPDVLTMPSIAWARVRAAALAGEPRRAWFMWAGYDASPFDVTAEMVADPEAWARANPALGYRIRHADVRDELAADRVGFIRERLGVVDWPNIDGSNSLVVPLDAWDACTDPDSMPLDPVWLAFDVSPDRSRASVAVGGLRGDGLAHVEVIETFRSGVGDLVPFLAERFQKHAAAGVVCDSTGPSSALRPEIEAAGMPLTMTNVPEFVGACGAMFDAVTNGTVRHRGQQVETDALRATVKRPLGDRWAWDRIHSNGDITPFVADTLALWATRNIAPPLPPELMFPS